MFRVHREVFISFQMFWGLFLISLNGNMGFAFSLAQKWPINSPKRASYFALVFCAFSRKTGNDQSLPLARRSALIIFKQVTGFSEQNQTGKL